jgi:hypothetical protein
MKMSMVDVELINGCADDITAYGLGLSDRAGSEPVRQVQHTDLLNLLEEHGEPLDPYIRNDILRRGRSIRVRLPVPDNTPKYLGEASVTSIVFFSKPAVGDPWIIQAIVEHRRDYLEGLIAAKTQLAPFRELVSGRGRFRARASAVREPGATRLTTGERLTKDELDKAAQYSEVADSQESWELYLSGRVRKIDRKIDIYTKHSQVYITK